MATKKSPSTTSKSTSTSKTTRYVADHTGSARDGDGRLYEYTAGRPFEAPEDALAGVGGITPAATDDEVTAAVDRVREGEAQRLADDPVTYRGRALDERRGVIDAGVSQPGATLDGPPVHLGPGGSAANADPANVKTPEESVSPDTASSPTKSGDEG